MKFFNDENKLKFNLQLLASEGEENSEDEDVIDNEEDKDKADEPKTFTQEEVNALIAKAKKKERKKAEAEFTNKVEEEKRLALLSESERKQEEDRIAREKFEAEKAEFKKEKMLLETQKLMNNEGLPIELASYVVRDTAEETMEELKKFKAVYLKDKGKGTTPKSGGGAEETPAFLKGLFD